MSLIPEDFPFSFPETERESARRLLETAGIELMSAGTNGYWRIRYKIFKRTLECWAEKSPKTGAFTCGCECPSVENTGMGCSHLFGLCSVVAREAETRRESRPDRTADIGVLRAAWVIDRSRSHGKKTMWLGLHALNDDGTAGSAIAASAEVLATAEGADDVVLNEVSPLAGGRVRLDRGGGFAKPQGPWPLEGEALVRTIAALSTTGRLFLNQEGKPLSALAYSEERATFAIELGADAGTGHPVTGVILRGESKWPARTVDLVITGSRPHVVTDGTLSTLETYDASEWVAMLLRKDLPPIPQGGVDPFLTRLAATGALPRLWLPDEVAPMPIVVGEPVPVLTLTREGRELAGSLGWRYATETLVGVSAHSLMLDLPNRRQILRDPEREAARLPDLAAAGLAEDPDRYGRFKVMGRTLEDAVASLVRSGFEVRLDGRVQRRGRRGAVRLVSGIDWFELKGTVDFDGIEMPLPGILEALRKGRTSIALPDGSEGLLPAESLRALSLADELGTRKGDSIRLQKTQGALVAAIAESPDSGIPTEALEGLRDGLAGLLNPTTQTPPKSFVGELRPYQSIGLGWLRTLESSGFGGILADDMGLGKTVQILAWLADRVGKKLPPDLVVAPRSLVFNWVRETARFAPKLRIHVHADLPREERGTDFSGADLVITTYGLLRRDIAALSKVRFRRAILDEAQAIKNSGSQNSLAASQLDAGCRVAMSGTPVENRAEEIWALFRFAAPGLLGKEATFGRLARVDESRAALARVIRPLVLRRTKEAVAPDLPERIEQTISCELTPEQANLYAHLVQKARESTSDDGAPADGSKTLHVLEALTRLRQVACHPGLLDPMLVDAPSGKLEVLLDGIEELRAEGRKAIVFSSFVKFLEIIRKRLEAAGHEYAWLDGSVKDREAPVKRFQESPACGIFLASLGAGGHGLNLTAADTVYLADPWWNPAVEAQAIDRAHRIGRKGTVFAVRLVARDTVEERMQDLKEQKRDLAARLLAGESGGSPLSLSDLMLLLQ